MKPTSTDSSSAQLSQLVHDLRTPLSAMITALRIIERGVADNPKMQEAAELGLRGGDEMKETIDRLHQTVKKLFEPGG